MVTLKIWHGVKHDDFTVSEKIFESRDRAALFIEYTYTHGYFNDDEGGVVPWHRINYFEIVEGETEEWCGAGEKGGRKCSTT